MSAQRFPLTGANRSRRLSHPRRARRGWRPVLGPCLALRRNVVELDEVYVFASSMPCDLEEIAYAGEAAFAGEARRDLFERDRDDGIDFDLAFFELVSPAGTNVRTHPDANASRDRTTSHAIAQVFREQHRASVARCLSLPHPGSAARPSVTTSMTTTPAFSPLWT